MLVSLPAEAHVKWFSEFSYADRPLTLAEAVTPTFLALALLSIIVIGALVPLDVRLRTVPLYRRVNDWLARRSDRSVLVMRITAGAVLLLSWQSGAVLVPELRVPAEWVGWYQYLLAFLLLFRRTVPIAGIGLLTLFVLGVFQLGLFHMLDYVVYAGAGYFLAVSNAGNSRVKGTGIPALYLTVGFSLCWVALEKIIYPQWGLYVLQQNPQLALGLPVEFFLVAAAFVEFSLGYLLIIGLLERPMALIITIVFFLTTLVFGKLEVIGHTLIHGALIVFLIEGPGRVYPAPVTIHSRTGLRTAFASINFALLLTLLIIPYSYGAWQQYEEARTQAGQNTHPQPLHEQTVSRTSGHP